MMRIFNIAFEKSAGAVIFNKQDGERKYLLLLSDHWDFVKGHLENGENEKDAFKRELIEETGVDKFVLFQNFKNSTYYSYKPGDEECKKKGGVKRVFKKVVFFLAETNEMKIELSREHKNFQWLGYQDALEKITYQQGKKVLSKAENFLKCLQER